MVVNHQRRGLAILRLAYYVSAMIRSWRNTATRRVWDGERPKAFRGLDVDMATDLLLNYHKG